MQIQLKQSKVNFIGDPHFGKKFGNVALHRQGEREAAQLAEFKRQLHEPSDVCIMVGDLFDTYLVSNEVLFDVYNAIREASLIHPEREFLMMEGNHDVARNSETVTSFDVLVEMLDHTENVHFFQEASPFYTNKGEALLICPYSMFKTAEEEVSAFKEQAPFDLAVGHWDTDIIAGPHNLCPFELLSDMTKLVVTGHVHTAEEKDILGFKFFRTGSMLPYSHGEDPEGKLYVTHTLEQVRICLDEDPTYYHDKCLRVLLLDNEEPPANIDCLQYSEKKVAAGVDPEKLEVKMDSAFSFQKLFDECFRENEIPDDIRDVYWEIYQQKAHHDSQS